MFQPGENQIQILKRVKAGSLYFDHNEKRTPANVIKEIKKMETEALDKGFTNLEINVYYNEFVSYEQGESRGLILYGDRTETVKEFNKRIEDIKMKAQSERRRFLQKEELYQSAYGKEILKELGE